MAEDSSQILKKYRELLRKSPTAYSPGATPSQKDIFLQRQVKGLERSEEIAEAQRLKEQWYTERSPGAEPKDEKGMIGKILHAMMVPGYAVTGAIETALGKGTEKGLLKNIKANIREQGTYGDLIRSYGVNNYVAMPLGLALDIALDPLAWATMGTSAIIPRTAIGAMKATKAGESALKGARLGAESSLLGKAAWTGKAASAVGKKFGITGESKGLDRFAKLQKSISEKALKTSGQYDRITGEGIESIVKHSQRDRWLDKMSRQLDKTEFGRGVKHVFEYSSKKQTLGAFKADEKAAALVVKAEKGKEVFKKGLDDTKDFFVGKNLPKKEITRLKASVELKRAKEAEVKLAEQVQEEIKNIKNLLDKDPNALARFTGMNKKEMKEVAELVNHYKIGVDKYNKGVAKVMLNPKARKFFDNYAVFIGIFKNMKIGFNPATRVNALVGNPTMTAMTGVDVFSPGMMKSLKNSVKIITSKDYKHLVPFLKSEGFMDAIKAHPKAWEEISGLNVNVLLKGKRYVSELADDMMKSGKYKSTDIKAAKKFTEDAMETFVEGHRVAPGIRTTTTVRTAAGAPRGTYFSAEIFTGPYAKRLEKLKASSNPAKQFMYKAMTKSMESYNAIDQGWRLALIMNLGIEGISRRELHVVAKRFRLGMKDVKEVGGKFVFSPLKSMEIAQAVYMNYGAMPPFVQAMRGLPLVGHNFISFAYGMTSIAAETAMYNPMFYNKISYLLHEISGEKSPLEKQALESGYYQWLQKPGMMKIPLFQDEPVYFNTANMIPHYTMNLLQAPERDYESKYGKAVASMIDKLPFFKTPDGQVAFDYVIMPMLLQGERPQGMFGQPLYPKDASLLERTGYASRTLAEAVLPPVAGYLGLGVKAGLPPGKVLPYIPHYRFRQLGYATEGKSSLGIPGKEPASEKTAKVMAAMAGLPYYPIKLQYQEPKKKK